MPSFSLRQLDEVGNRRPPLLGQILRLPNLYHCSLSWLSILYIKKNKNLLEFRQINWSKHNEINNLHLRVVRSWASASSVGSGPSPQVVRQQSVTKKWKVLSTKKCDLGRICSEGRLTTINKKMELDKYNKRGNTSCEK